MAMTFGELRGIGTCSFIIKYIEDYSTKLSEASLVDKIYDFESYMYFLKTVCDRHIFLERTLQKKTPLKQIRFDHILISDSFSNTI